MRRMIVSELCKSYDGRPVLQNLSFSSDTERITCLRAPSGTGKTTLLRLLLGLERPDSGTITLPRGCRWSAVFQENRLLEHLDAMGNLRFVAGPSLDDNKAKALLEELGLAEAADKPVRAYSGGMKRRLALIRALLVPCDALALDEPFAGLDEENRRRAWACVRRETAGKIVLVASHEILDGDLAELRL